MSKDLKFRSKKEIKKMSVNEVENYLTEIQNYLDIKDSKELIDLEKMVREILLEKYSG